MKCATNAAVALVAAACGGVVAATILGVIVGHLTPWIAWAAFGSGLACGVAALLSAPRGEDAETERAGLWTWLTVAGFALFSLRAFGWLVYSYSNELRFVVRNNLGDLSLHLTFINHLASGARFWPDNPIFPGEPLRYPLGMDLLNSLIVLAGMDPLRTLLWTGLIGAALCGIALYRWGGAFTLAGFLFNGGLAGFAVFQTLTFQDYQDAVAWKSLALSMLVPQRGLLYAIPAGALLLAQWRERLQDRRPGVMARWVEWLLYAMLPLFHVHTFLFLSLMLGCWALAPRLPTRRRIFALVALALVPATLSMWLVTGGFGTAAGVHIKPGWMQGEEGFIGFWLTNFGAWPLVVLALCLVIVQRRDWKSAAFVAPALGIFLLSCVVMFSRWDWDNMKLLLWCYVVVLPFVWKDLLAQWSLPARAAVCVCLFTSGFVSTFGGLDRGYTLANREELAVVTRAVNGLDPDAIFAATPTYNHPLLLAGRKLAHGYDGHLWSYGIDYRRRSQELHIIMNGSPGWRDVARRLGVRYVFWGDREREEFPDSGKAWSTFPSISAGDWGRIYDVEAGN